MTALNPRMLRPRRWRPPRARTPGGDALPPLRLLPLPAPGPEDVVVDVAGKLLTGVADGSILRVDPATGEVETMANTGGRPLGLHVCEDGSVLVCDSVRGLLRVPADGADVEVVVGSVDGVPLNFASNVVADQDGTIYFSASTRRFDLEHYLGDILEHSGTGRLFRLRPGGDVETLLDGLQFANGVVLAPDRSCVLVAQTGAFCVTRYWLTGANAGTADLLIDNLPGSPDNMALGSDGLVWVSLPSARNPLLDRLLSLPGVVRQAVWLAPQRLRPAPARTVYVLGVGFDGRIVHELRRADPDYAFVTSVIEHDGALYLGGLHEPAIAVTHVPRLGS